MNKEPNKKIRIERYCLFCGAMLPRDDDFVKLHINREHNIEDMTTKAVEKMIRYV